MITLHLFKIQVFQQRSMFTEPVTPSGALRQILETYPKPRLGKPRWVIGKVIPLQGVGAYFRIGKLKKASLELLERDDFEIHELDTWPFTYALLDYDRELCLIAYRAAVATRVTTIANRIADLLSETERAKELGAEVYLSPIPDPRDLIEILRQAARITEFTFTYRRPNAWDAHEDYQKPFQRLLQGLNGNEAETKVNSEDLEGKPLEDIAAHVAATGSKANARVVMVEGQPPSRHRLGTNYVTLEYADEIESLEEMLDALSEAGRRVDAILERRVEREE